MPGGHYGNQGKVIRRLEQSFPNRFSTAGQTNVFAEIKKQNNAIISSIIADFEQDQEKKLSSDKVVDEVNQYLISLNEPKDFGSRSTNNAVRYVELSFEKLCTSMEEAGINNPKGLTVFEFYAKLDYFEDKKKQIKK